MSSKDHFTKHEDNAHVKNLKSNYRDDRHDEKNGIDRHSRRSKHSSRHHTKLSSNGSPNSSSSPRSRSRSRSNSHSQSHSRSKRSRSSRNTSRERSKSQAGKARKGDQHDKSRHNSSRHHHDVDKSISRHSHKSSHKTHSDGKERRTHSPTRKDRYGMPSISEDDYFKKNPEFRVWLKVQRKILFDDLVSDKAHKLFAKFVRYWNEGRLPREYYVGLDDSVVDATERTSFKWNFAQHLSGDERLKLDSLRDSVHSQTRHGDAHGHGGIDFDAHGTAIHAADRHAAEHEALEVAPPARYAPRRSHRDDFETTTRR